MNAECVQLGSSVGLKVWFCLQERVLLGFCVWWVLQCQTQLTTELDLSVHLGFSANRGKKQVDVGWWWWMVVFMFYVLWCVWMLKMIFFCQNVLFCILGDCWAGFYCDWGSSRADQALCPAGFFCPSGTPDPVPCPAGAYSSETGNTHQDNCTICTPGYFCQGG